MCAAFVLAADVNNRLKVCYMSECFETFVWLKKSLARVERETNVFDLRPCGCLNEVV